MNEDYRYCFCLLKPGPRPPFYEVVDHVYGAGSNVDTEGDSFDPHTTEWKELYMQLRPPRGNLRRKNPLVQIWMVESGETMCVGSDDEALALKAAAFLSDRTGATLTRRPPAFSSDL